MDKKVKVSVIVPAYNEEGNIAPLFEAFDKLRRKTDFRFELILVDDGSTDGTAERARSLMKKYKFVKLVSYGVIFDADLQFDPEDIPPMVKKLDAGADVVAGYKVGKYQKPVVSRIYNLFGKILFRVPVRDMNAMKALRREVLEQMPFRPDWHRYIVVWAHTHGYKIVEHPVKLRPRLSGKSKYRGIGRVFIGFFDMLSVWFQLTFVRRPMLFFGTLGLFTFALAFLIGVVALILRFGFNMGYRPLLTLVAMLANLGLLLMIGGFLGEIIEGVQQRVRKLESQMRTLSAKIDELAAGKSRKNNSGGGNSQRSSKRSKSSGGRRTKSEGEDTPSAQPEIPEPVSEEKNESPEQAEPSPVEPSAESAQPEMIWGRRVRKKH